MLRYAAHAIERAGSERERLERGFVERLARAPGNTDEMPDAARLFRERARSVAVAVAAGPEDG